MITIKEIKPIKLSGLTSLLVFFDFRQDIVDTLKLQPTYYYHKKLYA